MKNLILSLILTIGFIFTQQAFAVHEVAAGSPIHGASGATLPGYFLVAGGIYLAYNDDVQACDNLPIKKVKAKGGNYFYDVAGCEYSDKE